MLEHRRFVGAELLDHFATIAEPGMGAGQEASNTPLHLTALGHSYGSSTTGYALGHDTPVQDAMLFGSPGQGAEHLKVPQGHLFAAQDAGDTLVPNYGDTGALGPSPYFSPDASSYHQMSTDASVTEAGPRSATEGHSGYLDAGSTSMYNMAAITTGHPDLAQYKGTVLAEGPR
ncbi:MULTISPECIES: alpha/beta hydrolase [Actinomycetes]|uniref:alpha/beta hydrolase n=1 Tax=Actinomycetes TaxID=1760 RepID=UPI0001B56BCE|nr:MULTISPECIES: alpha/beta hydrolase [Actinomycetes]